MTKKQWVVAIVLLLLIPAVLMLGGMIFNLINPEIAAGHPNYVRAGYELCTFVIIGELAYQAMVLKHTLMIKYHAATSGVSEAQIIGLQNASSGMWAFTEGMEVMFLVVLLYLLRPMVFRIGHRVAEMMASPKAR